MHSLYHIQLIIQIDQVYKQIKDNLNNLSQPPIPRVYQIQQIRISKRRNITNLSLTQMKLNKIKIDQNDIAKALKSGNGVKLAELSEYEETLELHIPSRFTIAKSSTISASEAVRNDAKANIYSSENPIPRQQHILSGFASPYADYSKISEMKNPYYSLIKMLFPQVPRTPPLSINVIDTIFFNPDGSSIYIYTDTRKGLTKVKAKNYTQLFMKRKAELNSIFSSSQQSFSKVIQNQSTQLTQEILKGIDYAALLRYKDQTFIRLKENQFKSIFVRPVQAYQKYKMVNNTHYLQLIPQPVNFEEDTIKTIEFKLEEHENTQFFNAVIEKHSQETSFIVNSESQRTKNQIKSKSIEGYLLYTIFQIYAYISIHYHKQITNGIFQFMKVGDFIYLSNVRKLKLNECESIKREYARQDLFQEFVQLESENLKEGNHKSGLILSLEQMFDKQNKKICDKIHNFIQSKMDGVQNKKDVTQSNQIFKSINQKCKHNLNSLLENDKVYAKFLKKKEIELDGLSPLTSISNISRKKYKKQSQIQFTVYQNERVSAKVKPNKQIRNQGNKQNRYMRVRPVSSKWYKQTIKGGRECFIEKW